MGPRFRGDDDQPIFKQQNSHTRPRIPRRDHARTVPKPEALGTTEGVGNAGCWLHPQPRVENKNTRVSHREDNRNHPAFPHANGFNGFLRALSGDRAFLPPSPADRTADLMPASRHQDHTTSPSASAAPVLRNQGVHRIPHPTSVTIAKRPSGRGGTGELVAMICPTAKAENFLKRGWT
jgi:hypothetical protein